MPSTQAHEGSILDIALLVARNRRLISRTILGFAVIGLLLALFSTSEYTSSAKVIREVESENPMSNLGGLALLRGIGVNLGSGSSGLTPDAYPDVLNSREVRLAVVRDTFFFQDLDESGTFTAYINQKTFGFYLRKFTIGLPGTILNALKSDNRAGAWENDFPTTEEEKAIKAVSQLINTEIDSETGLMLISSTTRDPYLSADLTQSFVDHLVDRIEVIRTEKAKRDLAFINQRFIVAQDSLKAAENALALFDDRNTNPQSARLKTQRARLQRQVTFKTELFSDLQAQQTQAAIDFQRSRPVITILEKPVPPVEPSGPKRFLTIVVSLILGSIVGIALAVAKGMLDGFRAERQGADKFNEIVNAFSPAPTFHRIKSRLTSKSKK